MLLRVIPGLFPVALALTAATVLAMPADEAIHPVIQRQGLSANVPPATGVSFASEVKPILDNRCVVCHGCYDAPCQLKLESTQALRRGTSKGVIFDGTRLKSMAPTRMNIDARNTARREHSETAGRPQLLGIPNVQDWVIQQALLDVLSPIFEKDFSSHSYGYRPGRSAHDTVKAAQGYVQDGKTWVVDVDTSAFFDEVDHDILMARVGRTIRNKRVLRLIGAYLRAPLRWEGREEKRNRGTPQGGPLSPLLANITLDALDRELERRTLSFCRYADDVAIFVTRERILESLTAWIAKHLKLRVNATKSGVD